MKQKVAGKEAKKGQLGPGHGASPVGSREDSAAVVAGSLVLAGLVERPGSDVTVLAEGSRNRPGDAGARTLGPGIR